jgi:hypothetical protein
MSMALLNVYPDSNWCNNIPILQLFSADLPDLKQIRYALNISTMYLKITEDINSQASGRTATASVKFMTIMNASAASDTEVVVFIILTIVDIVFSRCGLSSVFLEMHPTRVGLMPLVELKHNS